MTSPLIHFKYSPSSLYLLIPFNYSAISTQHHRACLPVRFIVFSLTVLLLGCSVDQPHTSTPAQTFTIVYSSDLDGELEPCGCTVDTDYGGIQRQAAALDTLRTQHPNLILLSGGGLLDDTSPLAKLKNQYIISGLILQKYDAIALQAKDLSFGISMLMQDSDALSLPWVATNPYANEEAINRHSEKNKTRIPSDKTITRGSITLRFFNSANYQNQQGETISLPKVVLIEQLKAAKANGHFTILSVEEGDTSHHDLVGKSFLDILMTPMRDEYFKDPVRNGNTLILPPGNRGMSLGVIQLTVQAGKISDSFIHNITALDNAIENAPRMDTWYEDYNKAVEEQYQENAARRIKHADPVYASDQTCKTCHSKEHEIWSQTDHSKAFADLQKVSKAFDPACIGCHVVGFDDDGGFINEFHTPNLKNVQCESCHGMGVAHTQNPITNKPSKSDWTMEQVCTQCHNKKHSPKFDAKMYWPQIQH